MHGVRGFNPCYNGKGIIALVDMANCDIAGGFNPCYNGKGIIATCPVLCVQFSENVSILVIMERG